MGCWAGVGFEVLSGRRFDRQPETTSQPASCYDHPIHSLEEIRERYLDGLRPLSRRVPCCMCTASPLIFDIHQHHRCRAYIDVLVIAVTPLFLTNLEGVAIEGSRKPLDCYLGKTTDIIMQQLGLAFKTSSLPKPQEPACARISLSIHISETGRNRDYTALTSPDLS